MAGKAPQPAQSTVPTTPNNLTQVEINQIYTNALNDLQVLGEKLTTRLGSDPAFDGLKNHIRKARDDAAAFIGLVKKDGGWVAP